MGSSRVGPDLFIVLNDSASPKVVIKMYSTIFPDIFLKVLELFNVVEATCISLLKGTSFAPLTRNDCNTNFVSSFTPDN